MAGVVVAVGLIAGPGRARATLGELEATVDHDRVVLSMERAPPAARGGVVVHELGKPTVSVREFEGPSGRVFAVAWAGLARPDLAALMGSYHAAYRAAASARRTGRGPRRVEAADVVVETWGHGRDLHGRAWVPSLVPPGANLDDVR